MNSFLTVTNNRLAISLSLAAMLFCCQPAHTFAAASDDATNYGGGWTNGSNGGSGFGAWDLSGNDDGSTLFAGNFLGDSTLGAGDINTAGNSFALYANPGSAFMNAERSFDTALATGETFSFNIALNFDNGNKGFSLFASTQGEIFNFNVGVGGAVLSQNATLNSGTGTGYDYGGSDAVFNVTLTLTSTTSLSYDISRTSTLGFQGTLFSGTVTGISDGVDAFRFYNSGTGGGDSQNNIYFNSLVVVPEPTSFLLILFGLIPVLCRRRTVQ